MNLHRHRDLVLFLIHSLVNRLIAGLVFNSNQSPKYVSIQIIQQAPTLPCFAGNKSVSTLFFIDFMINLCVSN